MSETTRITKSVVDRAHPRDAEYTIWDSDIAGFGLRVYPSGRKVYCYKYRVGGGRGGTIRKPKIGVHGAITPDQARSIAGDWAAEVHRGGDPSGQRHANRAAPRMGELFDRYLTDHAIPHKKASSVAEDEALIRIYLRPAFDKMKVAEVARADIDQFHKRLAHVPYRANRSLALLSKAFNLAEVWGWRPDASNPCRHIKKYHEEKRERFLSQEEIARVGAAFSAAERGDLRTPTGRALAVSPYSIAAIRLLIFTGARRGEILTLKWDYVNLERGHLELPDSKTGRKLVYLPPPAIEVLTNLPRSESNPYVIQGRKDGAHLVNPKDAWKKIRHAAGVDDLRIHDLRHSFASVGAAGGMSLPVIGALLGHRSTATTARYAHLSDDPLRAAADLVGNQIKNAMMVGSQSEEG